MRTWPAFLPASTHLRQREINLIRFVCHNIYFPLFSSFTKALIAVNTSGEIKNANGRVCLVDSAAALRRSMRTSLRYFNSEL